MTDSNQDPEAPLTAEWLRFVKAQRRFNRIVASILIGAVLLSVLAFGVGESYTVVYRSHGGGEWRGSLSYVAGVLSGVALAWAMSSWRKSKGLS